MSNTNNKFSTTNRAMLVGAIAGGGTSVVQQWNKHQTGLIETNELVGVVTKNAIKAGAIAGATTYVADKMAGRPVLSMLTILSVGAAGLYLLDQLSENHDEQL